MTGSVCSSTTNPVSCSWIVRDLFCLQFYNKSSVMQLAVPAVVKLLDCENRDLCRSVSSYLSLAAIDNADLLAKHTEIIVTSVFNGKENVAVLTG